MAINEALEEYLALYHKGEVNAVTSRELECSFQMRGSELVPSRFMRKFICRLRLSEVSRQ